ncbi:hypothetical protein D3C79_848480 [compost metagenome]
MVALARADGAVGHQRVVDVEFGVHCAEGIVGARLAPGLGVVAPHLLGIRHLGIGANDHPLLGRIGVALGMADIGGQAQPLATKVQAEHGHLAVDALLVPLGVASLLDAIEAQAELAVLTKAPADVHGAADLAV